MLNRQLLDQARFHLDNPALFGIRVHEGEPDYFDAHSRFLSRHVQVSEFLFPGVAESIQAATGWLLGNKQVHAFISSDESINATCTPGPGNLPIIWLSSGLIKTLSSSELQFVIGHELGHWYYRHFQYPVIGSDSGSRFVAGQQLSRASEVSADRFGLIACRDLDVSLRAILKTASGLTDEYLGGRVSEFATQTRSMTEESINHGEVFASHPPMVIRARALLWFSMSGHYSDISGLNDGGLSLDTVNSRVEKELSAVLGKKFFQKQSEEIQDAVFWMTIFELTNDGHLSKKDQELIETAFGAKSLYRLKNLLSGKNMDEVREEVKGRAAEASEIIAAYSTAVLEEYLEKNSQIAKHASKFLSRFN